jgi:pre-60S factor REI1
MIDVSTCSPHRSLEANLEYMWHKFGFYLPDAQYLKDPEGLIKYLVSGYSREK